MRQQLRGVATGECTRGSDAALPASKQSAYSKLAVARAGNVAAQQGICSAASLLGSLVLPATRACLVRGLQGSLRGVRSADEIEPSFKNRGATPQTELGRTRMCMPSVAEEPLHGTSQLPMICCLANKSPISLKYW